MGVAVPENDASGVNVTRPAESIDQVPSFATTTDEPQVPFVDRI